MAKKSDGTFRVKVRLIGQTALLQHNERLANHFDEYTKALKDATKKRTKTEQDHLEIDRLEFEGGLYWDEELGPYVPETWVRKAVIEAARITKSGMKVERGLLGIEPRGRIPIKYDGPRDVAGLYTGGFRHRTTVKLNGKNRVVRCRPMFPQWEIDVELICAGDQLDEAEVIKFITDAGMSQGIGDGRKIGMGRFEVTEL